VLNSGDESQLQNCMQLVVCGSVRTLVAPDGVGGGVMKFVCVWKPK
jgi:hypothetical protein